MAKHASTITNIFDAPRMTAGKHVATGRHAGAPHRFEARRVQGTPRHAVQAPVQAVAVQDGDSVQVLDRMPAGDRNVHGWLRVHVPMGALSASGIQSLGLVVSNAPKRDTLTGGSARAWLAGKRVRALI